MLRSGEAQTKHILENPKAAVCANADQAVGKGGYHRRQECKIKTPFFDTGDEIAFPLGIFLLFPLGFFLLAQR